MHTENAAGVGVGGAMAIADAQVLIECSSFRRNSATRFSGGAIDAYCSSRDQCEHTLIVSIANCTFDENIAVRGGAITSGSYHDGSTSTGRRIRLEFSTFTRNRASTGGAVVVGGGANTQLHYCIFVSNNATTLGGACGCVGW